MPTKAKTTVGKTPACLDKSGEDGHLGGGKIRPVICCERREQSTVDTGGDWTGKTYAFLFKRS
jgi:hypothetical protein